MSLQSHLEELVRKHRELDARIADEQRSPGSDEMTVKALKKRKLRLKEQIERSRQQAA
jgi:hypothetical protein